MNPDKRRELLQRAASVPPPSITPQIPGAPPQPAARGYEVVPPASDDPAKVQASGRGTHLPPGTVKGFGPQGTSVTMVEGTPQAADVRVRGAAPVSGAKMGASVTMHNASRATSVRGATIVGQSGHPVAPPGIGPQPARQIPTPNQAPTRAWAGGATIPTATPTAAAAPIVDLTIMLSQRARPTLIERQRRAIDTSTVRPAAIACFVNPVGVQLNDRALAGIATIKAGYDMGPWMRWRFAEETETKYVLVLDDDCIPGLNWMRLALERLELAEQRGEKIVVAAAGHVYQSDSFDDVYPVGPEAPRLDEVIVDTGRGGWMLPREALSAILAYPRLGSMPASQRLAVGVHVAAALQDAGYHLVVLPFSPADKASWGMLESPLEQGSTSAMIDAQAKAQADYPATWYREDVYTKYRAADWETLVVMASAPTEQLDQNEFGVAPIHTTPVPAALQPKAPAPAPSAPKESA